MGSPRRSGSSVGKVVSPKRVLEFKAQITARISLTRREALEYALVPLSAALDPMKNRALVMPNTDPCSGPAVDCPSRLERLSKFCQEPARRRIGYRKYCVRPPT